MLSNRIKVSLLFFLVVFFAVGFLLGRAFQAKAYTKGKAGNIYRENGNYQFISPLLDCDYYEGSMGPIKTKMIKQKLEEQVHLAKEDSRVKNVSVYFRDLSNGSVIEIDGNEKFTPASLLKVPLMITMLKMAESKPGLLAEKTVYKYLPTEGSVQDYFTPAVFLQDGVEYTFEEVVKNMIKYSNNDSAYFLSQFLDPKFLERVYMDLGIAVPGENSQMENFMTVKEYASFFRILYNSSYLNREMSEKALLILSQSNFRAGLVAGLPTEIKVAHKFGERKFDEIKQLHDCGIIYHPKYPYILCVMTRGSDNLFLSQTINDISKTVYNEISK